jgi:hypothetical protein
MERMSEEKEENAIIWVAHSLGGILVKRVSVSGGSQEACLRQRLKLTYLGTGTLKRPHEQERRPKPLHLRLHLRHYLPRHAAPRR